MADLKLQKMVDGGGRQAAAQISTAEDAGLGKQRPQAPVGAINVPQGIGGVTSNAGEILGRQNQQNIEYLGRKANEAAQAEVQATAQKGQLIQDIANTAINVEMKRRQFDEQRRREEEAAEERRKNQIKGKEALVLKQKEVYAKQADYELRAAIRQEAQEKGYDVDWQEAQYREKAPQMFGEIFDTSGFEHEDSKAMANLISTALTNEGFRAFGEAAETERVQNMRARVEDTRQMFEQQGALAQTTEELAKHKSAIVEFYALPAVRAVYDPVTLQKMIEQDLAGAESTYAARLVVNAAKPLEGVTSSRQGYAMAEAQKKEISEKIHNSEEFNFLSPKEKLAHEQKAHQYIDAKAKDIEQEERRRIAEAQAAQARRQAALKSQLELRLAEAAAGVTVDGQPATRFTQKDLEKYRGMLSPSEFQTFQMKILKQDADYIKDQQETHSVFNMVQQGTTLVDDKQIDRHYKSKVEEVSKLPPAQRFSTIIREFKNYADLPSTFKKDLSMMLNHKDPNVVNQGLVIISQIQKEAPLAYAKVDPQFRDMADQNSRGVPTDVIMENRNKMAAIGPAQKAERESGWSKELRDGQSKIASAVKDATGAGWRAGDLDVGVRGAIETTAKSYYLQGMSFEAAVKQASVDLAASTGRSEVGVSKSGASKRVQFYPPEKMYNAKPQDIEDALNNDAKDKGIVGFDADKSRLEYVGVKNGKHVYQVFYTDADKKIKNFEWYYSPNSNSRVREDEAARKAREAEREAEIQRQNNPELQKKWEQEQARKNTAFPKNPPNRSIYR